MDGAVSALMSTWSAGWQANALLAVLISFFTVSIAYMLSVAFDLPNLKRWSRQEFVQAAVSSILVLGLVAALSSASPSIVGIMLEKTGAIVTDLEATGAPLANIPAEFRGGDPFEVTQFYLGCAGSECVSDGIVGREYGALKCMKKMYTRLYAINFPIEVVEKSEFSVGGIFSVSGWALAPFVNLSHFVVHNLSFLFIAIYFQKALLVLIKYTMLAYFLPVGIVLRTFPLTRGAGALMIGLAIGLYFFYPLAFTLVLSANAGQIQHAAPGSALPATGIESAACVAYETLGGDSANVYIPQKDASPDLDSFARAMLWLSQNTNKAAGWLTGVEKIIPFLMHEVFLYPLVALTITFTVTKALADLFGADVSELASGLVKLI